jgi:hypothetical protein
MPYVSTKMEATGMKYNTYLHSSALCSYKNGSNRNEIQYIPTLLLIPSWHNA